MRCIQNLGLFDDVSSNTIGAQKRWSDTHSTCVPCPERFNKVPVGVFDVNGPVQGMAIECTLGTPCNVKVSGWGFKPTNRILVIAGDDYDIQ